MIRDIREKLERAIDVGVKEHDHSWRKANGVLAAWMAIGPKEAPKISVGKVLRGGGDKDGIDFWFVNADALRKSQLTRMPTLQELLEWDDRDGEGSWVLKFAITYEDAFLGVHSGSIVAVTHCWETKVRAGSVGDSTSSPIHTAHPLQPCFTTHARVLSLSQPSRKPNPSSTVLLAAQPGPRRRADEGAPPVPRAPPDDRVGVV